MEQNHLGKNISLLETKDPALAAQLRKLRPSGKYIVSPSKSGAPTLTLVLADGTRKTLHSSYNPLQEASRFIDTCKLDESLNFIVGGIGLGYHVLELVKRIPKQSRLIVIEKDPELLRLALEQNDFTAVLNHPGTTFHAGIDAAGLEKSLGRDKMDFALDGFVPVSFKPLADVERPYYESLNRVFQKILQEGRLDLKTQAAFSKLFFKNIMENTQSIVESPGILPLRQNLPGIPAVIISAGPSLDKNISLLKSASDRAVLITVATALKPLLNRGIAPDFVVAIDPDDITVKAFDSDAETTWLLYDPCIPKVVVDSYKHRRLVFDSKIFLAQWISRHNEEKGVLGKTLSVAHTGFLFAKHLGCDPIILVGQDLSFTRNRLHCSDSFFIEELRDSIGTNLRMEDLEKQNREKYTQSLAPVPDIFGNITATTIAMDSYNNLFAEEIKISKRVYNATEGGVPIPGAFNLCLKEALNLHCKQNLTSHKKDLLKKIRITGHPENLTSALKEKSLRLENLHRQLKDLKKKYLDVSNKGSAKRKTFVAAMESLYKTLLKEEDTLQLLQGYSYSGFLQWNRENREVSMKSAGAEGNEELKYERDRKFLEVLMKATDFVGKAFEKTAERTGQRPEEV